MNSSDSTRHDDSSRLQWQKADKDDDVDNEEQEQDEEDEDDNSQLFSVRAGWNSISKHSRQNTERPGVKDFRPLTKMQMQLAELQSSTISGSDISSSGARGGGGSTYKPSSLELAISKAQAQRAMKQQVYRNSSSSFSESADATRGEIVSLVSRDNDDERVIGKLESNNVNEEDEDEVVPEQRIIRKKGGVR